jgi:membrane protein implicated in regulation of membrane protease activity
MRLDLAATKPAIMMVMIGSLSCGILAIFLWLLLGVSLIIAIPGLIIGAFFAFRYAIYDRSKTSKQKEEEHRNSRRGRRGKRNR